MEKWKKVQLITGVIAAIGGLLIPIVIFLVSQQITKKQDEFNKEQKKSERVATLLSSLSSENERERRLALSYTEYLVQNDMFPEELLDVFLEIIRTGTPVEAGEAQKILTSFRESEVQMKQLPEEQIRIIDEKLEAITPRVFIRINYESQRTIAKKIRKALLEIDVEVQEVNLMVNNQQLSELRFFNPEDEEIAHRIAAQLNQIGLECQIHFEPDKRRVRAKHFELWLGNEQVN